MPIYLPAKRNEKKNSPRDASCFAVCAGIFRTVGQTRYPPRSMYIHQACTQAPGRVRKLFFCSRARLLEPPGRAKGTYGNLGKTGRFAISAPETLDLSFAGTARKLCPRGAQLTPHASPWCLIPARSRLHREF